MYITIQYCVIIKQYKCFQPDHGGTHWQDNKSLVECNRYALTYEVNCDVTFLVGKNSEPVKAHAYVLSTRNAQFASLLARQASYSEKILKVDDRQADDFRDYLMCVYFLFTRCVFRMAYVFGYTYS